MSNSEKATQLRESIAFLLLALAAEAVNYVETHTKLTQSLADAKFMLVGLELEDGEIE